ncbi:MAG: hypothetical protein Q4P29_01465 [Tissierellia bacterium]|nr:hypothetical protein [Tissierellia bacterium]
MNENIIYRNLTIIQLTFLIIFALFNFLIAKKYDDMDSFKKILKKQFVLAFATWFIFYFLIFIADFEDLNTKYIMSAALPIIINQKWTRELLKNLKRQQRKKRRENNGQQSK